MPLFTTMAFGLSAVRRTKSRDVVAPANGMFSLIDICAFAVGLTASMKMLPTGTRATVNRPSASVVAAYALPSVRLVTLIAVSLSG